MVGFALMIPGVAFALASQTGTDAVPPTFATHAGGVLLIGTVSLTLLGPTRLRRTPPTRWSCVRTTTRFPPSRRRMECELRHDSEPERVLRIVSAAPDRLVVAKS